MAGCMPCFIIPLLLFIFHRFIQPLLLKFWNPWENKQVKEGEKKEECKFSCDCAWNKNKSKNDAVKQVVDESSSLVENKDKVL